MNQAEYIRAVQTVRPRIVAWAKCKLGLADEAEDVAQEVLLRLWTMHGQIDGFADVERLARVLTRNLCHNVRRNNSSHATLSLDATAATASGSADSLIIEEENNRRLLRAASSIPDKYRTILHMRNTEGLSYSEIATLIGSTESSVRGMVSKARTALIQKLKPL